MLATKEIARTNGDGVTYAARPLNIRNLGDSKMLDQLIRLDRVTGERPWKWFENLGEIHFALMRAARIAGYAKLFAARFSPDGKEIDSEITTGPAVDAAAEMYCRFGGTRGLIERFYIQQKVPGESHLVRWKTGNTYDGYLFASSKECSTPRTETVGLAIEQAAQTGGLKIHTLPALNDQLGNFVTSVAARDYLGRVWAPSPIWLDMPESPLNPMSVQCELLHDMTLLMSATMKSRFVLNGLMFFPSTIGEVLDGARKISGGTGKTKSVLTALYDVMKANVEANDQSKAVAPILLLGDPEAGEKIKHITVDREILETDMKLRGELIDRILFGLDIIPQATTSGEDVNHFGAWQASADELRLAVIPDIENMCWALTRLALHRRMRELQPKVDTANIGLTYDLSAASVRANQMADAKSLQDLGLLGNLPTLKAGGFTAQDAMMGVDLIRWAGRITKDPYLMTYGDPEQDKVDWSKVASKPGGRKPDGTPDLPAGPGVGDPGSPDDEDTDRKDDEKPV